MNLTTAINAAIQNHQRDQRTSYLRGETLRNLNQNDIDQLQACLDLITAHKLKPTSFSLNSYGGKPEINISFVVTDSLAEMATTVFECLSPYDLENWKSYDAADGSFRTFTFAPQADDPFALTINFFLTETSTCQRIIVGYKGTEECVYTKTRKPITKIICS